MKPGSGEILKLELTDRSCSEIRVASQLENIICYQLELGKVLFLAVFDKSDNFLFSDVEIVWQTSYISTAVPLAVL